MYVSEENIGSRANKVKMALVYKNPLKFEKEGHDSTPHTQKKKKKKKNEWMNHKFDRS